MRRDVPYGMGERRARRDAGGGGGRCAIRDWRRDRGNIFSTGSISCRGHRLPTPPRQQFAGHEQWSILAFGRAGKTLALASAGADTAGSGTHLFCWFWTTALTPLWLRHQQRVPFGAVRYQHSSNLSTLSTRRNRCTVLLCAAAFTVAFSGGAVADTLPCTSAFYHRSSSTRWLHARDNARYHPGDAHCPAYLMGRYLAVRHLVWFRNARLTLLVVPPAILCRASTPVYISQHSRGGSVHWNSTCTTTGTTLGTAVAWFGCLGPL